MLARTLAVGVCGTDREILAGDYGSAPKVARIWCSATNRWRKLRKRLTVAVSRKGDLIVGVVRHPDPEPCEACAADEWDMCRNGMYTEHGIKDRDGFCRERFRTEPKFAVRISPELRETGVLLEPASVVAKAWDHIERIGRRAHSWRPRRALITGAGPVGLLAAMMAQQRGCEVHVYDHHRTGPKRELVERSAASTTAAPSTRSVKLSARRRSSNARERRKSSPASSLTMHPAPSCASPGYRRVHTMCRSTSKGLNRRMVLENDVVFGSVNANRGHYERAAEALAKADPGVAGGAHFAPRSAVQLARGVERRADDIKVVIDFTLPASSAR